MIAPEVGPQDVTHNLAVLSQYGNLPKPTGSYKTRLLTSDFSNRIFMNQVSKRTLLVDIIKYKVGWLSEKEYGISGVARRLTQIIPLVTMVRDLHLLQSAQKGLTKLTNAVKGDDEKDLLRPLSTALVAHINTIPKHHTTEPKKSALKIDVTDHPQQKSKKRISFGTNITFPITPHGNRNPIPHFVITHPPKKSIADIRSPESA